MQPMETVDVLRSESRRWFSQTFIVHVNWCLLRLLLRASIIPRPLTSPLLIRTAVDSQARRIPHQALHTRRQRGRHKTTGVAEILYLPNRSRRMIWCLLTHGLSLHPPNAMIVIWIQRCVFDILRSSELICPIASASARAYNIPVSACKRYRITYRVKVSSKAD